MTKTKKDSSYIALAIALKENQEILTIFPDIFQVWKFAGQVSRFVLRIQDCVRTVDVTTKVGHSPQLQDPECWSDRDLNARPPAR